MTQIVDLCTPKHIHIVGIGGSGMNAIASVLARMGHMVSGSDAIKTDVVRRLRVQGITVAVGHDAQNVPNACDIVAHSTAIAQSNVERQAAAARGIVDLRRADVLASIARRRKTLAVAGTHGKTTTSTLLTYVLEELGVEPSWVIGGEVLGRDGGACWTDGEYFVVEADESDGTFLELGASGVIVTNVEPDHLEQYGSLHDRDGAISALHAAFSQFVSQAPGPKIVCHDDEGASRLVGLPDVITYGQHPDAHYNIRDITLKRFSSSFTVLHEGIATEVLLRVPGLHNVQNAVAAFAMGRELGGEYAQLASALQKFVGVGRRFQLRGEARGVTFVDEYAHLPGEIRAALDAAKAGDWRRIVVVFQPHRYSRTEQVGRDFGDAFDNADVLFLTDIYSAGETPRPGIDGTVVLRAVEAHEGHPVVEYVASREDLAGTVAMQLQEGDLCITVGAGDITELSDEILQLWQETRQ